MSTISIEPLDGSAPFEMKRVNGSDTDLAGVIGNVSFWVDCDDVPTASLLATHLTVPMATFAAASRTVNRCHTSQLRATAGQGGMGLGNVMKVLRLTNVSDAPCRLYGYPGLQLLDNNHRTMPTQVSRGDTYFRPDPGAGRVTLGPGETASFVAAWGHVPPGPELCPASGFVRLTPPDETDYLTIPVAMDACNGWIQVTALVAGANGPPQ